MPFLTRTPTDSPHLLRVLRGVTVSLHQDHPAHPARPIRARVGIMFLPVCPAAQAGLPVVPLLARAPAHTTHLFGKGGGVRIEEHVCCMLLSRYARMLQTCGLGSSQGKGVIMILHCAAPSQSPGACRTIPKWTQPGFVVHLRHLENWSARRVGVVGRGGVVMAKCRTAHCQLLHVSEDRGLRIAAAHTFLAPFEGEEGVL